MTRTLDGIHTALSYVKGSLQNTVIVKEDGRHNGFVFSLRNPPVPLGGNIVSLDIYINDIPVERKNVFIATGKDLLSAEVLSEERPLPFKPYQSARFLVVKEDGLKAKARQSISIMSRLQGFQDVVIPFKFEDRAGQRQGAIILEGGGPAQVSAGADDTNFGNFSVPLVLSGKKAYVVCSSNGAISADWTWMGVTYDNGGLYVPPVRVFGRIAVEVSIDDGVRHRLPNFVVASRHENGMLETQHEIGDLSVKRTLVVPLEKRGFIMKLELALSRNPAALEARQSGRKRKARKIRIHFVVDGNITSYGLAAISQGNVAVLDRHNNCLRISSAKPDGINLNYFGLIGVAPKDLLPARVITDSLDNDLEISYDLLIADGEALELALVGAGGLRTQQECLDEFLSMRREYGTLVKSTIESFVHYSTSTPRFTVPERSKIHRLVAAYEKTKTCLQYLKTRYDGLGEGICAGLPRFPNYWARDTGWTLRGYLALGDYAFARKCIDNFLKHQATGSGRLALRGELPMIISGKAFLHGTTYGSADSTFLFPPAILEYVLGTGDLGYLKKNWEAVKNLVEWGFLKDIDGDGLVENDFTGVAQKLSIRDSTWMDHIDRRKSANDIQALFYGSLVAGAELAGLAGDNASGERWARASKDLLRRIDERYWNKEDQYYYDTIRKDGSRDQSVRPNALVLLLTGAVQDRSKAAAVLSRVEQPDMTTGWGIRTLSANDEDYRPTLYHDGAVWPLVTGWAVLCELRYGRREKALMYLSSMAERIMSENGMFAETYRGDRPEPFNSCILQAWSAGLYAWAFSECMLGLRLDLVRKRIEIEPQIPPELAVDLASPMKVEHSIPGPRGLCRLSATIDPANQKISVVMTGGRDLAVSSSSYQLDVRRA